jgi:hypothetical protein
MSSAGCSTPSTSRHVPGRKTDVSDSACICQLLEHGLVRPSFVPPKPIRELRDLTRYRRSQIEERTRVVQRLEKVLQDAGIKLTSVASRILSVSGRDMLEAMLAGHGPSLALDTTSRAQLTQDPDSTRVSSRSDDQRYASGPASGASAEAGRDFPPITA